ncbi:LacI family DNA-binding transcriptional regulator [Metallococcus carri]|nr:LacI family DNA-binding transcriptional regulator [Metallococcus carri]
MAKLAEIAAHAGVSEATVSRVLNDKTNVAEATRALVLTSIDVLGYERPSNLRRRMVGLVGLIVPELTNPVFPLFAQTIQTRLAAMGYTAVLCTQAPGGAQEDDYISMLLERGVAGVVFVSGRHADLTADLGIYRDLSARGLPMVTINGHRGEIDAPSLSTDERASVRMAVAHLRQLGHTRIGLATGQGRYVPSERKLEAFRELVPDGEVQQTWFSVEGGELAGRALIESGVTGIVCGSDLMALGVIRAAEQAGVAVPEQLSVIGYDGSLVTQYTWPPLTTLRQDVTGLSGAAVHALGEEIAGHPHPRGETLFAPELIVRSSTAPPPR